MKFWTVTTYIEGVEVPKVFLVQSPYDKARTKEILLEVHPEYKKMSLKKTKKPNWVREWST
jgi:hypothetical protein